MLFLSIRSACRASWRIALSNCLPGILVVAGLVWAPPLRADDAAQDWIGQHVADETVCLVDELPAEVSFATWRLACSDLIDSGALSGNRLRDSLLVRAKVRSQDHTLNEAFADYQRLVTEFPEVADGWAGRGTILIRRNLRRDDLAEGLQDLDRALQIAPDHYSAMKAYGIGLGKMGRNEEAVQMLDRALALQPDSVATLFNKAIALNELDRYDAAITTASRAIEIDPDYSNAYVERGNAYRDSGRFDRALADYDRALAIDPDNARALKTRSEAYRRLGRLEEAFTDVDRALQLVPGDLISLYGRARLLIDMGYPQQALVDLNRIVKAGLGSPGILVQRGRALLDLKRIDEAEETFIEAIETGTGKAAAWWYLGRIRLADGRPVQALRDFSAALAIDPEDRKVACDRATAASQARHYKLALTDVENCLKGDPDNGAHLALHATMLMRMEYYAEAAQAFDTVVAHADQKTEDALVLRGIAYGASGDMAGAVARLAEMADWIHTTLDRPEDPNATVALRLYQKRGLPAAPQLARIFAERAGEATPDEAFTRLALSTAALAEGNIAESQAVLEQLMADDEEWIEITFTALMRFRLYRGDPDNPDMETLLASVTDMLERDCHLVDVTCPDGP